MAQDLKTESIGSIGSILLGSFGGPGRDHKALNRATLGGPRIVLCMNWVGVLLEIIPGILAFMWLGPICGRFYRSGGPFVGVLRNRAL